MIWLINGLGVPGTRVRLSSTVTSRLWMLDTVRIAARGAPVVSCARTEYFLWCGGFASDPQWLACLDRGTSERVGARGDVQYLSGAGEVLRHWTVSLTQRAEPRRAIDIKNPI